MGAGTDHRVVVVAPGLIQGAWPFQGAAADHPEGGQGPLQACQQGEGIDAGIGQHQHPQGLRQGQQRLPVAGFAGGQPAADGGMGEGQPIAGGAGAVEPEFGLPPAQGPMAGLQGPPG